MNIMYLKGLGVVISFISPSQITSKNIIGMMRESGLDVEVLRKSLLDLRRVLTRKQSEVLLTAVEMNYFSELQQSSLADISNKLGVSKSTVSRHLRAAMKKLALGQAVGQPI